LPIKFKIQIDGTESLRKQICDALINSIEVGELPPGSPLPPTRELADLLEVSRDTVVRSYGDLQRLSYITSSSTRGFSVSFTPGQPDEEHQSSSKGVNCSHLKLSAFGQRFSEESRNYAFSPDFSAINHGAPPKNMLPMRRWQLHTAKYASQFFSLDNCTQVFGQSRLRKALAGFLNRNKQLSCAVDQVAVFSNTLSAVNLLCRILVNPGETIAVEDPGYGGIRNIAVGQGANLIGIPTDDQGIIVDELYKHKDVRMLYVSPGHVDPNGAVLSLSRRKQLLQWAHKNDVWVIEDDYEAHFQYEKSPLPTLAAMDKHARVIYISSFWKVLYPLTALGYCVLPSSLVPLIERTKVHADGLSELIVQYTLADIIEDGYLERHIRKVRKIYQSQRTALIFNFKKKFGQQVSIPCETSGTHTLVRFTDWSDARILYASQLAGLPMLPTSSYYFEPISKGEFVIDFSCLDIDDIEHLVTQFKKRVTEEVSL
jgi:GntR family transcriptional regulator/MocR family aminotransferase